MKFSGADMASKIARSSWRVARTLVLLSTFCVVATAAGAQKLSIQGDRFAVDGEPRFLTFISMFGLMGAPNFEADLHTIKTLGFDGFRIWPNLDTGPQIFKGDGSVGATELARLRSILDQARRERLIVDVSFTFEHTPGLTAALVRPAIMALTDALRAYDNVLFDIQNERNVGDRRHMSEPDVRSILAGIRSVDPARITTASNSPVDSPEYAADFTARLGLDVTAYHEPRTSRWYWLSSTQAVVSAMRSNGRPAYLQEPMSTRDNLFPYPAHDRAEYFLQAIGHAKLAGAAAWCFHTDVGTDYRTGPALLEDRLRSFPEPEWAFVNSLKARVMLRASNGVNYVVAEGGGGAGVRADRTAAGPGAWEEFGASALGGGPLIADDRLSLAAANGSYLQATGGGGSSLRATAPSVGASETFRIEKSGGGMIRQGDAVALRVEGTSWYVTAEGGGGGSVMANVAARAAWEMFTVLFLSPHSTDPEALQIQGERRP
jgi:hypothetical protein